MDERSGQLSGHHNLGENAVLYIMERLAELRADLRACRSDYQRKRREWRVRSDGCSPPQP